MTEPVRIGASLVAVALFIPVGWVFVGCIPWIRNMAYFVRVAWAWLFGVAYLGVASFLASHAVGLPLKRRVILPLALLPPLVGGVVRLVRRSRRFSDVSRVARPWKDATRLELLAFLVGSIAFLAILGEALANPIRDWDGRMTWCAQARYFRGEWTVSPRALTEARWFITHPQYPPLLPLVQVVAVEILSTPEDERIPRPLYAAFLPAYLIVLYSGARLLAGRRAGAAAALTAALLPFLVFDSHGGAAGCYSDLPLASFAGAGLLLLGAPSGGKGAAFGAGLLLGAVVLSKNEGLPIAVAALAAGALVTIGRLRRAVKPGVRLPPARLRRLVPPMAFAVCAVAFSWALLSSWRRGIPNRNDEQYELLIRSRPALAESVRHLRDVVPIIARKTFSLRDWSLFWWTGPVLLLVGGRARRHGLGPAFALAAATPPLIGLLAYAIHGDAGYLCDVTWSRFLEQGSIPFLLLLAPVVELSLPTWLLRSLTSRA